jgi:hypothetical protein
MGCGFQQVGGIVGSAMSIPKPVIFFSHSSRDKVALKKLKDRFVELTGGTVEVFLSSDGQSIRLGSNWVSSIEKALKDAKIMFVFVSPNSLNTPWLYFETGHAYSKEISVVPVGLFGVDIGKLSPPMNLLQGFNLVDVDSMNNIIAKVNEVFDVKHKLGFKKEDYAGVTSEGRHFGAAGILGEHFADVRSVDLKILVQAEARSKLEKLLADFQGYVQGREAACTVPGASVSYRHQTDGRCAVGVEIDPIAIREVLPLLEKAIATCHEGDAFAGNYHCRITFKTYVRHVFKTHGQTARLVPALKVASSQQNRGVSFEWRGKTFRLERTFSDGQGGPTYTYVDMDSKALAPFEEADLGGLVDLLFEREVLFYEED